ncbi:M24 family metallopeptidase [Aureibacillus halotolerans]|uniref:Xaa-Pro aminopeptidase n=1 Tax=Aureibacillus halotolerans TaxID=1508390 RepID=A0A4R6U5B3_9BACI|nr:Xaa-Pro peptidase family protein [Aureibacillus halotolerans]TDQ41658.1 Xaa-Pro aminopeptidase [Aureibacillus halotolerans]
MRLKKLQAALKEQQLDGIIISNASNRRYITRFTGTAGLALVTASDAIFMTDFRYIEQANAETDGFEIVKYDQSLWKETATQAKRLGIKRLGFEKTSVSYSEYESFAQALAGVEFVPTRGLIEQLRQVKDDDEVKIIQEAARIADAAFDHVLNLLKPGVSEWSIANELEMFMRNQGAASSSFDTIVASGKRSALPHGVASTKRIESGDFVTLDFGAYYQGYCSDITRTVAVGEPSDVLKKIYNIVLDAQKQAVASIAPGKSGIEIDAVARDLISKEGYGPNFGHSTGHGIGLEVHEGPSLSIKGEEALAPGMIVTVEPGIYVAGIGGVRIEDDVLVTESGHQVLTHSTKELIIL